MFKQGQKLVCINADNYKHVTAGKTAPLLGEVVTCAGPSIYYPESIYISEYYIADDGHPVCFKNIRFRPLDDVLEEVSIAELLEQPVELETV